MRFTNQTDRKLIVAKEIGHGVFYVHIAADAKSFSEEKYEYNPMVDWDSFFVGPETKEHLESPTPDFAILAPGESLQNESEYWTSGIGHLPGPTSILGALQPGNHVLGVWVNNDWPYHAKPEEIQKRWESFGDLVYKSVEVGPVTFNLPGAPKIDKCH